MAKTRRGKSARKIPWDIAQANSRREIRQTHDGPEVPPHRSRKNTRRWCRGVVGCEHDYTFDRRYQLGGMIWVIRVCRFCGKNTRR